MLYRRDFSIRTAVSEVVKPSTDPDDEDNDVKLKDSVTLSVVVTELLQRTFPFWYGLGQCGQVPITKKVQSSIVQLYSSYSVKKTNYC